GIALGRGIGDDREIEVEAAPDASGESVRRAAELVGRRLRPHDEAILETVEEFAEAVERLRIVGRGGERLRRLGKRRAGVILPALAAPQEEMEPVDLGKFLRRKLSERRTEALGIAAHELLVEEREERRRAIGIRGVGPADDGAQELGRGGVFEKR